LPILLSSPFNFLAPSTPPTSCHSYRHVLRDLDDINFPGSILLFPTCSPTAFRDCHKPHLPTMRRISSPD
jgi:hypothetical protein